MLAHGVYPCRGEDRWIAIACVADHQWQTLRSFVDPTGVGWPQEERFSTLLGRKSAEDDLDRLMAESSGAGEE